MVDSLPDLRAAVVACLLLLPAAAQAASPRAAEPGGLQDNNDLVFDGSGVQIDYGAKKMHMRDVTISQGNVRIQAREATANGVELSFDDSRWEFRGDVRIRFEDGNLTSDSATVSFAGNRIARAAAVGAPAQFEQKLASMTRPARGRANNIDYDVQASSIRLSGSVWFSDGLNELNTQALIYDIRGQRARSDNEPGEAGRVHMTIRPDEPAGKTPPAGKP